LIRSPKGSHLYGVAQHAFQIFGGLIENLERRVLLFDLHEEQT
jgi:hypothetical protein